MIWTLSSAYKRAHLIFTKWFPSMSRAPNYKRILYKLTQMGILLKKGTNQSPPNRLVPV